MDLATFWATFSRTHLVTLPAGQKTGLNIFVVADAVVEHTQR
jgi:hypothetical protein